MKNRIKKTFVFILIIGVFASSLPSPFFETKKAEAIPVPPIPGIPIPGLPSIPGLGNIPGLGGLFGGGPQKVEEVGEILSKEVGNKPAISIGPVSIGLPIPGGEDGLAWVVAKALIDKITNSLIKWADNGFDGDPLFATQPGEFLLGIADNVAGDFIKSAGFGALCSPFSSEVKIAVLQAYNDSRIRSREPYAASCTLSGIVQNVDEFVSGDFSQGGWGGWFELTQSDQGNPYSAVLDARNQLAIRIQAETGVETARLNWNRGFISFSECVRKDQNNVCLERGPTRTPGSIIEGKLIESFGSDIRQLELADEMDEILADILGNLIGNIFGGNTTLFKSTGGVAGNIPTFTDDYNQATSNGSSGIPGLPNSLTLMLRGGETIIIYTGGTFIEPGFVATDPRDGVLTRSVSVSGFIDTNTPGIYQITYSVSNSYGDSVQAIRTIIVQNYVPPTTGTSTPPTTGNNTPPQIRLAGQSTVNLNIGDSYIEMGYTAFDQEDGVLTGSVNVTGTPTDTSFSSTYTITYSVTDSGGLSATEVRFVIVGAGGPVF